MPATATTPAETPPPGRPRSRFAFWIACVALPFAVWLGPASTHVRIVVTALAWAALVMGMLIRWAGADRRRRRIMFRLLLAVPVMLLSFELLYAWTDWREAELTAPLRMGGGSHRSGMLERGEPCGYHLIPARSYAVFGGTLRIDANGFRNTGDVSEARSPGVRRLMLLGGSTAFGWGLPDGEDLAAHLQEELSGAEKWEVINAAVPYYTSWQEACAYTHRLHRFQPDVVVVLDGRNDVRYAIMQGGNWTPASEGGVGELPFVDAAPGTITGDPARRSLLMRSALYRRVYARVAPRYVPPPVRPPAEGAAADSGALARVDARFIEQFNDHRRQIAERVTRDGGACILALQPVIHVGKPLTPEEQRFSHMWDDLGEQFGAVWPLLRSAVVDAEGPGVRLDLTEVFADFDGQAYLDECHYTSAGSRRIAEVLAEQVLQLVEGAGGASSRR